MTAEGRRRLQAAKVADGAATKRRVAEARRRADALVAEEREAADADASRTLDEVAARNEAEREDAEREATEARERAEAEMAAAQEQLAEARALADEAAEAARSAADEAHRRARAMTEQAEAQSRAAEERAAEADQARGSVAVETAEFVRQAEKAPAVDDVADKTKPELLDLAASLDIEGRSAMTKGERDGDPPGVGASPHRVGQGGGVMAARKSIWRRTLLAGAGALRRPQGVHATAVHGRAGGRLMAAARKGSLWRRALLAGAGALRRPPGVNATAVHGRAARPPDGRRKEAAQLWPARAARRGRGARRDVGQRGRVLPEASRGAVTRARP